MMRKVPSLRTRFTKDRSFLAVLLGAVSLCLLWGYAQESDSSEIAPAFLSSGGHSSLTLQHADERDIRPVEYRSLWTVAKGALPFYGMLRLKVDRHGRVFVADYGDLLIKVLSPDGGPGPVYGEGRGQGPGELTFLNDFEITDNGELWISDQANGRINVFKPTGELHRTLRTEELPYRIALKPGGGEFFSLMIILSGQLFARFDADGRVVGRYGELIEDQAKNSLALDGWLDSDGEDGLVYAGLYGGLLARYGANGEKQFAVRTMDGRPLPRLVVRGNSVGIDQAAPVSTASLSVTGDEIHLLTYYLDGFERRKVIDTYSKLDGSYLYSRHAPEDCTWFVQAGDYVYTVSQDMKVSKWQAATVKQPQPIGSSPDWKEVRVAALERQGAPPPASL